MKQSLLGTPALPGMAVLYEDNPLLQIIVAQTDAWKIEEKYLAMNGGLAC